MLDKLFFEQIFRKVEPESFLYEFVNSGDPLYFFISLPKLKTYESSVLILGKSAILPQCIVAML